MAGEVTPAQIKLERQRAEIHTAQRALVDLDYPGAAALLDEIVDQLTDRIAGMS